MNAPNYSQLLRDLLPAHEPARWSITLVSKNGISEHLIEAPTPGDAVDIVYDTLGRDDELVAVTVKQSVMWQRWRREMDAQLAETQLRG